MRRPVSLVLLTIAISIPLSVFAATAISPRIVATIQLTNQSAPIPATTIFTLTKTGLYRMSAQMLLTTSNSESNSSWNLHAGWSDENGSHGSGAFLFLVGSDSNGFATDLDGAPGRVVVFKADASQPVTFFIDQTGAPDGTVYEVYIVVERIM